MDKINFTCNWNNKLDCKVFTTLRTPNFDKYKLDTEYEIWLKNEMKGVARIHDIKATTVKSLPTYSAFLDTGYCLEETQNIIRKMYHLSPGQDKELWLMLLIYKKP